MVRMIAAAKVSLVEKRQGERRTGEEEAHALDSDVIEEEDERDADSSHVEDSGLELAADIAKGEKGASLGGGITYGQVSLSITSRAPGFSAFRRAFAVAISEREVSLRSLPCSLPTTAYLSPRS